MIVKLSLTMVIAYLSFVIVDIDECSEGYNCSHRCINTVGGVQCSCYEGYDFVSDNTSCTGKIISSYVKSELRILVFV